jgi:predicted RNA-binding protein with PUA-like domain
MRNYWLVKADPDNDYSIDDLARDGETIWDGVHNNAAILHIQKMLPGDQVYIYHSQSDMAIVGLAEVTDKPFLNTADPRRSWAVKLKFVKKFAAPLGLSQIKAAPECADFALVRIGRLSVMPVPKDINNYLISQLS